MALDTWRAYSSGIIQFQTEGAGYQPGKQFLEDLARGVTSGVVSGASERPAEILLFCFLKDCHCALPSLMRVPFKDT